MVQTPHSTPLEPRHTVKSLKGWLVCTPGPTYLTDTPPSLSSQKTTALWLYIGTTIRLSRATHASVHLPAKGLHAQHDLAQCVLNSLHTTISGACMFSAIIAMTGHELCCCTAHPQGGGQSRHETPCVCLTHPTPRNPTCMNRLQQMALVRKPAGKTSDATLQHGAMR
jgi:hypothetical protein